MKKISSFLLMLVALMCSMSVKAAINLEYGWFESAAVQWDAVSGAADYNVYIKGGQYSSYTLLDDELVRKYPTYYRADALGLKAGSYTMKVVPVDASGNEMSGAMESGSIAVKAYDRTGFAHKTAGSTGIGAYNNDGTLKSDARVLYVWANNAKTVSLGVRMSKGKDTETTCTGLQAIITGYQKGIETRPLDVRIIGTIKDSDMDAFGSSSEGLQIKGASGYQKMNITIEGVGFDANIWGFGFLVRNAAMVELRNFGIMLCMDDCVSLDTNNEMIWVHNIDFFYGNTGGDADQAKGDGSLDFKGGTKNCTFAYNHFWDSGKCNLGGLGSESLDNLITIHHNWFDHSDSRHPRIRGMYMHIYNNYYDGNSKYGVGMTTSGSALVEANYFRNCKYPMLISLQGTDGQGDGTFSGNPSGIIKSYGNFVKGAKQLLTYQNASDADKANFLWDCYEASSVLEEIPASVKSKSGSTYKNVETSSAMYSWTADAAADVPGIVKGNYGAGRMQHGDFKWAFNNSVQDENYGVITELKDALKSYKSMLVGFADGTSVNNGGATSPVDAGDGKGIPEATNDAYVPSYGGGGGTVIVGKYVIGSSEDYFWFNSANETKYNDYVTAGNFKTTGTFNGLQEVTNSKSGSCSDYIGSVRLPVNGTFTAYYEGGIVGASFYVSSNGSQTWLLEKSADGNTWKSVGTVTGKTGAHPACVITSTADEGIKYVRITNQSSGSRDVQGIKIATPTDVPDDPMPDPDPEEGDTRSTDATAAFSINGSDAVFSGTTCTMNVKYDADDAAGYTVVVEPTDANATIAAVTGATEKGANTYLVAAPSAGATATATFRILAENQANTKTYIINIVKGVDPSTIPVSSGEFLYFPTKAPSSSFFTVSGKYGEPDSYGSTTYVRNGETYECTYSLKLESSTSVKFTPASNGKVKICMSSTKYKTRDLLLNGEKYEADANNIIEVDVTANTQYTITKAGTAGIFYIDLIYEGSSPTPTPTPTPSSEPIYDFSAGVGSTVATTETFDKSGTQTAAAVVNGTTSFVMNKSDIGWVKITPKAGEMFKNGDVVTLTGAVGSADKTVGILLCTTTTRNTEESAVFASSKSAKNADTNVSGTLTLTQDASELYVFRYDGTSTTIKSLVITHSDTTGVDAVSESSASDKAVIKYVKNGKIVIEKAGKQYNAAGQLME